MKRFFPIVFIALAATLLYGCAILKPVQIDQRGSLDQYKYVYVSPTTELTSGASVMTGMQYSAYGSGVKKSVNPADIIAGRMIKVGFIQLQQINPSLADQTIMVNYGESGRRGTGFGGYTIEVTLQFIDLRTRQIVCICTAEGQGSTEADDIRIALTRCFDKLFHVK